MKLSESKIILLLIILAALILGSLYFILHAKGNVDFATKNHTDNTELINKLAQGLPTANWSEPMQTSESTGPYGEMEGQKITTTVSTKDAMPVELGDKTYLKSLGYTEDSSLAAGGPGSSVWGYSKTENGMTSVIIFSSNTKPTNNDQNAPVEFNCPCQTEISIFVSTPPFDTQASSTSTKSKLANPASVNCEAVGGISEIKTLPNGGQYGLCMFDDNRACEEWALYRGECPKGGVDTIGYDDEAQMYCAWLGGRTLAVPNATCTLPGGKVCSDDALYAGTCSAN